MWGKHKYRFNIGAGGRASFKIHGKLWKFRVKLGGHLGLHGHANLHLHGHGGLRWRWRKFHGMRVKYAIGAGGKFGWMLLKGKKVRFNIGAHGAASMKWKGRPWHFRVHVGGHAHLNGGIRWKWRTFLGKKVKYYIGAGGKFGFMFIGGHKVRFGIAHGMGSLRWKGKLRRFKVGGHLKFHGHGHVGLHGHGHGGIRWRWMTLHGKRVRYYLGAGGKFGFLMWGKHKYRFNIGAGG